MAVSIAKGNSKAFDSFNYTKETSRQDKKPTQTETSETNGPATAV